MTSNPAKDVSQTVAASVILDETLTEEGDTDADLLDLQDCKPKESSKDVQIG